MVSSNEDIEGMSPYQDIGGIVKKIIAAIAVVVGLALGAATATPAQADPICAACW